MNLIEEIATFLENEDVGEITKTIFLQKIPDQDGLTIGVIDTGAMEADSEIPIRRPTFQIYIRANTYELGKTTLDTVYGLLHGIQNESVITGGKVYFDILAMTEGGCLGQDETGRYLFSINFRCQYK